MDPLVLLNPFEPRESLPPLRMDQALVEALRAESKRIEEDTLYSARSHFEAAAMWSRAHYRIGVPTAMLAAIAGGSAIADRGLLAGIIGLAVTAMSAVGVFLNPSDRANQHHSAGTRFNEIRNQSRVYREIELLSATDALSLVERAKTLSAQRDELNKASPQIPRWAFERARRSIEDGEASYRVDQEPGGTT